MIELILGGARSGKSQYAEQLAIETGKSRFYIATAQAHDEEMRARIEVHKQRRSHDWTNIEESFDLANCLKKHDDKNHCLLVDCLTLWVSNLLHSEKAEHWQQEKEHLLKTLPELNAHIILVSNEVGSGIIPLGEITRQYVDEIGWLHQNLAKLSQRVTLITAGLPAVLKG
jgi:adenosylcobinamide kinase/adenosylcobinamide-phosphate guanylyltransferase